MEQGRSNDLTVCKIFRRLLGLLPVVRQISGQHSGESGPMFACTYLDLVSREKTAKVHNPNVYRTFYSGYTLHIGCLLRYVDWLHEEAMCIDQSTPLRLVGKSSRTLYRYLTGALDLIAL